MKVKITYDDKIDLAKNPAERKYKATADDFNEIKNVINNIQLYGKNQAIYFKTKQDADNELKRFKNLVEGVDYEISKEKLPFGFGENGEKVEKFINKSDLPNLELSILSMELSHGDFPPLAKFYSSSNKVLEKNVQDAWKGIDSNNKNTKGRRYTWYLNDDVEQTKNVSTFIERYEIIFLRKITIGDLNE